MNRPERLTATFVKSVFTPGRYSDKGSYGLSLLVKKSGGGHLSKSWSQALRHRGQQYRLGLGSFPLISLAEARDAAFENARTARQGQDLRRSKAVKSTIPTFTESMELALEVLRHGWKNPRTEGQYRHYLGTYAVPAIGRMPIDQITTPDVLAVVKPVALEKPDSGRKLRNSLGQVFKWAVAAGHRETNPANGDLAAALPKMPAKSHHSALPYAEVGAALQTVRDTGAHWATKLVFEFVVLTAARSGEARGATWAEVDLGAAVWTIPAERMKGGKEHRIPLSTAALAVLGKARQHGSEGLIFPSQRGKVMSDSTLSKLLRENGIEAVPHGFRSSFRDWAAESGVDRQVAEASLAHSVGGAVEAAYLRTDFFDRRRQAMDAWAAYLGQQP